MMTHRVVHSDKHRDLIVGQMLVTPSGIGMLEFVGPRKIRVKFGAEGPVESFWRKTGAIRHASKAEIKAAGLDGVGRVHSRADPA